MGQMQSSLQRSGSSIIIVPSSSTMYVSTDAPAIRRHFQLANAEDFDLTGRLSEDCLALVFGKLTHSERNQCALVCRRWLRVESQARQLLLLSARAELATILPKLLFRFEHITKLGLKCDRKFVSISDEALFLIGKHCKQLRRLKLKGCIQVTDKGLEEFSLVCGCLKKLSCGSSGFGAGGLNALLSNCELMEDLTVKKLKRLYNESVEIGAGYGRLKRLCLKDLSNAHLFLPLIAGSKHLQTLVITRVSSNWDNLLMSFMDNLKELTELRMEKVNVSDQGLRAIAACQTLRVLYIVKCPDASNAGLTAIAKGCRDIRKLHLDGGSMGRISDEGLTAIGKQCVELQELVLMRVNVKLESLGVMGRHCIGLERLAICNSDTFGDSEMSCVVFKCQSLKKLCIKSCPISDDGLQLLASGCPNLIKVKIKKCRAVSGAGATSLKRLREALAVVVDSGVDEQEIDLNLTSAAAPPPTPPSIPPSPSTRSSLAKVLLASSSFVSCTLLRRPPSS